MNKDIMAKLGAAFPFEEIEFKLQVTPKDNNATTGMAVFFLDARTIQKRLDEVLGQFNWKNQFSTWHNNAQLCGIAIYCEERNEWIGKFDGAECSDIEPVKGGLSDSFKRAACMWGIGRYLYGIDGVWVDIEPNKNGKGYHIKNSPQNKNKLKSAYESTVNRLFGTGANPQAPTGNTHGNAGSSGNQSQSPNNQPVNNQPKQPPTPPPAQNTNNKPQQSATQTPANAQKSQENVIPIDCFKIQSIQPSGGSSQLLVLCDNTGEITSGYIKQEEKGITVGAYLRNVKLTEKDGTHGKYNLIDSYDIAA